MIGETFSSFFDEDEDPVEVLSDFPLLRLPLWMEFEIVISPEDHCKQGDVEGWLGKFCQDRQMRLRVRVREESSIWKLV